MAGTVDDLIEEHGGEEVEEPPASPAKPVDLDAAIKQFGGVEEPPASAKPAQSQTTDVDALFQQFGGVEEAPPEPPKAPAVSAAMPGAATPPKQKSFLDRLGEIGDTEAGFADIASPAATAILKSPVTGARQIIKGAGEALPTFTAVLKTAGEAELGGKLTPPKIDVENVKAGVSDMLEGIGQMATIPTLVAGVANPVAVGRVVVSTFLAAGAAKTVAKYAGASESTQRFMEDVAAGAVAMGLTAFEVGKLTGEGLAKLAERGKAARAAADAEAAATNQGFRNAKQTPGVRTDRALPSNTPLPPAPIEARPVAPEPPSTEPLALTPDVQARAIEVLKDESASADDKQTATVALRRAGLSDEQIAAAVEPGEALKAVPTGDDVKTADVEEAIEAHGGVDETPATQTTGRVATLQKANGIPFSEAKQLADLEARVTAGRDSKKADVGAETALKDLRDTIEARTGKPLEMGPVSRPKEGEQILSDDPDAFGVTTMTGERVRDFLGVEPKEAVERGWVVKEDNGQYRLIQNRPDLKAEKPTATFLGYTDPRMEADGEPRPQFNIVGGQSDRLTVTGTEALEQAGIEVPKTPTFEDWKANRGKAMVAAPVEKKENHEETARKAFDDIKAKHPMWEVVGTDDAGKWVAERTDISDGRRSVGDNRKDREPPKAVQAALDVLNALPEDVVERVLNEPARPAPKPSAPSVNETLQDQIRALDKELGHPWGDRDDFAAMLDTDPADLNEHTLRVTLKELEAMKPKASAAKPHQQADLIEQIVTAARRPRPQVEPTYQLKGTDGKWYRPQGFPIGVNAVQPYERRIEGYSLLMPDGTRAGKIRPTAEEVKADIEKAEKSRDDDFRQALEEMPPERLQSQAEYWLKDKAPKKPETESKAESGPKVTYNTAQRSVEVKFAKKPEREVLDTLKANGFKWAKTNQLWYRRSPQGTPENNIAVVKKLLGQTTEAPKAEPVKKAEVVGYDREAAQKTFKGFRTALTRATNAAKAEGLTPEQKIEKLKAVVAEAKRFNDYYESSAEPWPDYHHDWVRAGEDAEYQIKRLEATKGTVIPGLKQIAISKGAAADQFEPGDRVRYNGLSFVVADPQREGDWLRIRDPKGGDLHLVDGRKVEYISKTPEEQGLKTEGFINKAEKKPVTPQVDAPAGSTPLGLKPKETSEAKKLSDYKPGEEVIYTAADGTETRGTVLDPPMTSETEMKRLRVELETSQHGAAYDRVYPSREGDVRPADKVHEYSSTQVDLDGDLREKVLALGRKIPKPDLAEEGLEKDPHVTIKWGLHALGRDEITAAFKGTEPFDITLGDIAYFSGKDGDVLHIQVESPELHALNEKIGKLPNGDEHPEYQPHITIAYLKPGKGKVYVQKDVFDSLKGETFRVSAVTTSLATGKKWVTPLVDKDTQEYLATPPGKRRTANGGNALEQALSPKAQDALAAMFKERNRSKDLRHIREALEVYERLIDMTDVAASTDDAKALWSAMQTFLLDQTRENADEVDAAAYKGLQTITGEDDPDPAELLENEVFASAKEAGELIFNTLDPKTASFDVEEFNTAFGEVEFRRDKDDVFPRPQNVVNDHLKTGKDVISIEDAKAIIDGWKAEAKRISKDEDHSNEVIYSLFDVTGEWSAPWRDAGYLVRQFDIKSGQDLMDFGSWMETVEEDLAEGRVIVGILGAPPCTSFAVSGARWWKSQHDIADTSMVAKKYGLWAAEHFERPLDYANHLVAVMKLIVEQANPRDFYAMENPIGRIAEQNALPKPTLVFDPANFGDPYTKQTQIWGDFNPDLPLANVEPTLGSLMHQLRGDVEADKAKRSETPEGFAYAFFMANHKPAVAKAEELPGADEGRKVEEGTDAEPPVTGATAKAPQERPASSGETGAAGPERRAGGRLAAPQRGAGAKPHPGRVEPGEGEGDGAGGSVPGDHGSVGGGRKVRAAVAKANKAPSLSPDLFQITDADAIGTGSRRERVQRNLAAIRIIKQLQAEDRLATVDERKALVQYVGWGGLPRIFEYWKNDPDDPDPDDQWWQAQHTALSELLSRDEYATARNSTQNAHYTSPVVIRAMWDAVRHLGVKNGSALEPAAGIGHFLGLAPDDLRQMAFATVEKDEMSAAITKALYPGAFNQQSPFEEATLPDDHFTVAISNVPFGLIPITDRAWSGPAYVPRRIHNYFFGKALTKVAPGGLVAFISSHGTLDARDDTGHRVREYLSSKADFLGAIRLPYTAFKGNAGTEVITDIIFLRKRFPGEVEAHVSPWLESKQIELPAKNGENITQWSNEYMIDHPEMVLGTPASTGKMRAKAEHHTEGGQHYNVEPIKGRDLADQLAEAVKLLPMNAIDTAPSKESLSSFVETQAPLGSRPFEYLIHDGQLAQNIDGRAVAVEMSKADENRVRGLLPIRSAVRELYDLMAADADDAAITKAQKTLNVAYDKFVKGHGPISSSENFEAFREDPDLPLLLSLEDYDEERGTAAKNAVFTQRTMKAERKLRTAASPDQALSISLGETGKIDLDRIGELLGQGPEQAADTLQTANLIIDTPSGWQLPITYLSGNVRVKHAEATAAAAMNPRYQAAADKLKAVIPEDRPAHKIRVRLGAAWVPVPMVKEFIDSIVSGRGADSWTVTYTASDAKWNIDGPPSAHSSKFQIPDVDTKTMLLDALNDRRRVVKSRVPNPNGEGTVVRIDRKATALARQRKEDLSKAFQDWLLKDDATRKEWTVRTYNDLFHSYVEPKVDGAYLTFPGMADFWRERMSWWQRNAVSRILLFGNTLLAHVVGAGKTLEMVSAIMELRRSGLARKPMMVVPNHLISQAPSEFLQYYPNAKVLVATPEDLNAESRKRFTARIAAGSYDAIIVPYSAFVRISMSAEAEMKYQRELLDDIELAIIKAWADAQESETNKGGRSRRGKGGKLPPQVKTLENMRDRIQARLKKLEERPKDDMLSFEQLGVDALFIDEAHSFKNLYFPTRHANVSGIPADNDVQRATDLYLKSRYINALSGHRNLVLATGTPVTNSMAEVFVMQKLLQEHALERAQLNQFDAWLAQFGKIVAETTLDPSGTGMSARPVLKKFNNLVDLAAMFRQVADVKMIDDLPELKARRPKLRGGNIEQVLVPMTAQQRALMTTLKDRADHLDPKDRRADNMPKITTDGRMGMLDMRLLDRRRPEEKGNKLSKVADNVASIWKEWKAKKGTQLVFLDSGTPNSEKNSDKPRKAYNPDTGETTMRPPTEAERNRGFNLYGDLKKKLVKAGIPVEQIAFIHDIDAVPEKRQDAARKALFRKVREGEIRVLIGSTKKMGTGMNVQDRLVALHHVEPTWTPDGIEQRNGRILRQGNLFFKEDPEHFDVRILNYLTTGEGNAFGFDAYMWQLNERKAGIISDFFSGDLQDKDYDLDLNQTVLTAGEMKAVATGNPKVIEFGKLQGDLERLELTKAGFEDAQREASYKLSAWEEALARDQRVYDREKETAAAITPIGDEQEATFGEGKDAEVVTGAKNVGDRILAEAKKLVTPTKGHPGQWKSYVQPKWIGSYHGLEMTIEGNGTTEPWLVLRHPQDDPPRYSENRPDQQYASVRFALMKPDPQGPGGQNWIESTTGLMMRVGNQVDNMRHPSTLWIDRDKDEIAAAQGALKGKFDQQDELMQTRLKVEELARELGLPLDNMGAEVTNEELDVDGETPPDDDNEPKRTKHKMLAVDDDFGEPSFARTESGRIKAGVGDEGAAARIMASSLYSKGIGGVAVKELFQNAVDAIRGVVDGAIVVKIGNIHGGEDPFVEVSDNGPGLTKEELETVFTDLFSSGKREQAGAAGGFGIAKASFLLGGKHVRVQTVVAQRGKGFFGKAEKVQYAFEATPEELTDPAGVHVTVTTMPADTPTGTIVRTTMPKDTSTYQGQSFIEDVLKYSPALPGTVTLDLGYHKKTYEPKERERAFAGYTRHELSVPGATLRLMISPKLDESTALTLKVANNGIYQMNAAVGTADPKKAEFMGPKLLMPEHVLVDVRALVPEGDPLYPFTANREEVRDDFAKAMRAAIFEDIIRPIRERSQDLLQDTYDKMATVAIGPRAVPILDSGKRMTDAELAALFAAPAVQRAVGAVLDVTRKVLDRVLGKEAAQVERVGILLDSRVHGVFIPNPRTMKSDTEARRATVLINPFQALQSEPTPDAMGAMMYHVAVHEAVHWHVGGHNEAFTVKLGDEFRKLGARFEIENLTRIMEAYAGGNLDNIDEEIAIALHRYSDARQRPVVEEDALSRTGHNLGRSADDGRAEAGDADGAGSDRAGHVEPHEMRASDKDALQKADTAIGKSKASIITIFGQAPSQDELVRHGFRTWRQRIAELEQRHTHAVFALKKMEAAFDRLAAGADGDSADHRVQRVRERILRIADALEDPEGTGAELPHELQAWAAVRDELFALEKAKQDALGVGLAWRDYYLGHIWQNNRPGAIQSMMAWMRGGRRPIEGPKTYRKKRTIPTMREGVEQFGKEPEDWNLVRVDLAKLQEMRKFTAAATWLERDLKPSGAAVFRSALSPSPDPSELRVLPGRFFEVWAPPTVEVREAFDYALMHGLESVMDQMGIPYTRVPDSRRAWGTTEVDKDTGEIVIQAKFGGPVDVLQHELGHALDERYKLSKLFPAAEYGDELEALAKLRHSLGRHSDEFREYVQRKPEQIANLVYAYLHAPAELKRVAPKTAERFEEFIESVPVLAGMLPDLQNMRSLVMGERSTEKRLPGPVLVGRYYAPVALAKAAERYLQPGLGAHPAWKIIRWPVNALVQWTLAWPMFHFFTVTGAAMADEGAQGLQSLMAGHPVQGLRKIVQAPIAPFLAGLAGTKVQDVYRDSPDVMAGAVLDEAQTLIMGGGRAVPSAEYSNRQMKAVMQNIRTAHGAWEHQLPKTAAGAALKAAFHLVPAAIEAAAWMIMDKYVPMVKAGSITRGIATDLANLKGVPTPETLRAIATKRVNQADALYGQVIWDNMALHVNRAVMNAMQLLIMAPGWRGGALVIALRAAADPLWRLKQSHREQYRLAGGGPGGGGGGKPPKGGAGDKEPVGDDGLPNYIHEPWFSSYLALFVMISVVGAAFAELWQLAHGAGHIQSPKDVAAPRDGSKDSDGKPHRDRFPGYQAIFYEMLNHLPFSMLKYALGGDSPLPKMLTEWYHNENQFGGPIWDPGDTFGNQVAQYARYLKTNLPIAVSSYQRAETSEQKRRALLYSASPAPRSITDTPAEALMRQYAPPRKLSQDDVEKLDLKRTIRAGSPEEVDAAINSGDLSAQEIINAIESGAMGTSADEVRFKQLPYGKALKVYKVASPAERAVFFPILVERLDKAVENSSPNQMQSILDEFNAAMELPVGK